MVRDGFYYGAALTSAGVLVGYLTQPWFGLPLLLLAAFCMYFFFAIRSAKFQAARWPFRPPMARLSQCVRKAGHGV